MHSGRVVFGAMDEVVFGRPASEALVEQLDRLGSARAFLMVSGTLNRQTDIIENIRRALGARCVGTFDAMPPHTPRSAVIAASEQARAANADLIVTIGGGSITDGAKAVQLCLANDIRNAEDIDRIKSGRGAPPQLKAPTVRQISVPTTIAGGEFSATAGVTNEKTRVKEALRHPLLMPRAVILDPWPSLNTPEWLWLSTGIRAVDHCVEGICSREAHPYADAQALKGLAMLAQALPRVKADANDLDARMDCQIGTWLSTGPLASGVPMGASHGIGYALGAGFGVAHGHTSCVLLPAVMQWNAEVNAPRQQALSQAMGQPGRPAHELVDALIRQLGQPRSLREVGITAEQLGTLAERALPYPPVKANPRPIRGADDVRQILQLCW